MANDITIESTLIDKQDGHFDRSNPLTVGELIDALSKMDRSTAVWAEDGECGEYPTVRVVHQSVGDKHFIVLG